MRGEAFALTSLQDRTLGSTIAFFFTDELVLCSFDVFQALWMMFDLGPHSADVAAWCVAMRAKAERVVVIPDREIASVRVTFRMIQDQLCIARERSGVSAPRVPRRSSPRARGVPLPAGRAQGGGGGDPAPRPSLRCALRLATTRAYAVAHRRAPCLTR